MTRWLGTSVAVVADGFVADVRAARVEAAARQHTAETTPDARPGRQRGVAIWIAAAAMVALLCSRARSRCIS